MWMFSFLSVTLCVNYSDYVKELFIRENYGAKLQFLNCKSFVSQAVLISSVCNVTDVT